MIKFNMTHPMLMKNKEVKEEIENLIKLAVINEEDENSYSVVSKILDYLDNSGFYEDPASTRYHLSVKGGLARHSLSMYRETASIVDRINEEMDSEIPDRSVIIACLFHDLCKAGKYSISFRNTKNDRGEWIQVPYYSVVDPKDRKDFYGHGSGSVILLMELGLELTRVEKEAILHHMGTTGISGEDMLDRVNAFSSNQLAIACHLGDMSTTFLIEGKIDNKSIEGLELL